MADPSEEDFSRLPYSDRFTHKNWKVRKEGYEAAGKDFARTGSEKDPVFQQFLSESSLWKDAAGDSNVAAQQEGLIALGAFLKYGGPQAASRTRGLTLEPIREKALSSTRPAAKAAAVEAVLLYVEIDKPNFVVEELLPALSHKQPKVIAATLSTLTAIFHNFGCKIVDPKSSLKSLPKAFGHADKNVRAEASNLTVELYRWLREALKGIFWNDLKPVQQQDLEKLFEKVKDEAPPKQERLTRAQQEAAAVAEDAPAEVDGDDFAAVEDDYVEVNAFDLAEPVDISQKIPENLHETLASSKWKERKDALDELFAVLNIPRIKDGFYDEIVRDLAKIIAKDANVVVVALAANCIEKLALGLKHGYSKYRSTSLGPMLERCKEKKQAVLTALGAALDAVFGSSSLTDCLEETLGFLTHKNPQVKLETVKFLTRCLKNTKTVPSKSEIKSIADAATKLLTESTEVMRSGGAEILGTLMKILGERAMGPYLDGLDDIRKAKIKEYFDTAVVKAKERPKPVQQTKSVPALGKRPVATKKPSMIKKAPAPVDDEPAPSKPQTAPRSAAKPSLSRPSNLGAVSGSKLNALKRPASGLSSPQRRVISPTSPDDETPLPSPAKFGLGRGLTGHALKRAAPPQPPSPSSRPSSTSLPPVDLAELETLRIDKQRLTALVDSLRSTNAKLHADLAASETANANNIEEHSRHTVSIKARENQLLRAREENECLKTDLDSARKEVERLKREMNRLGRESFGRDRERSLRDAADSDVYADMGNRSAPSLARTGSGAAARARGYGTDDKENPAKYGSGSDKANSQRGSAEGMGGADAAAAGAMGAPAAGRTGGEPENWRRAAEVTNQLKARIEMMRVSLII